ncbi:MAG: hypothetical protein ABR520_06560 [Mycobacteriales bacterium]
MTDIEQPYFIDEPVAAGSVSYVDPGAPWLFTVIALVIALFAVYYAAVFANGPRDSWRHSFDRGRASWTRVVPTSAPGSGQPNELTP